MNIPTKEAMAINVIKGTGMTPEYFALNASSAAKVAFLSNLLGYGHDKQHVMSSTVGEKNSFTYIAHRVLGVDIVICCVLPGKTDDDAIVELESNTTGFSSRSIHVMINGDKVIPSERAGADVIEDHDSIKSLRTLLAEVEAYHLKGVVGRETTSLNKNSGYDVVVPLVLETMNKRIKQLQGVANKSVKPHKCDIINEAYTDMMVFNTTPEMQGLIMGAKVNNGEVFFYSDWGKNEAYKRNLSSELLRRSYAMLPADKIPPNGVSAVLLNEIYEDMVKLTSTLRKGRSIFSS